MDWMCLEVDGPMGRFQPQGVVVGPVALFVGDDLVEHGLRPREHIQPGRGARLAQCIDQVGDQGGKAGKVDFIFNDLAVVDLLFEGLEERHSTLRNRN
jgi:hypothetical protein